MLFATASIGQNTSENQKINRKGSMYFYWGWNWEKYSKSDINFSGSNYNFTLYNMIANDRPSKFDFDTYFNPTRLTIPQYNFRLGYFLNEHYNFSIGIDHMKYVMLPLQSVGIKGNINNGTSFDGKYSGENIQLTENFLKFEHTDGLNYANVEFRRFDEVYNYKNIKFNITDGIGIGMLIPRTNTTLMNNPRYDQFHLAGFGIGAVVGVNIELYKYFFIQSEFKTGFINMPDIRTTSSTSDKASQHFFFYQINALFGARFNIPCPDNKEN
ncbi:MAG: hypothetical protein AUJ98_03320 [Bacteroidetes bacterium CG2_30_33_31]|nr:MAG: hypothetical protein AUJ98_03320 [Bacteroidetes bacterium CG2_30_33_31]